MLSAHGIDGGHGALWQDEARLASVSRLIFYSTRAANEAQEQADSPRSRSVLVVDRRCDTKVVSACELGAQ